MKELKKEMFECWDNGVIWVLHPETIVSLQKKEFDLPAEVYRSAHYPLNIRRNRDGSGNMMWVGALAKYIQDLCGEKGEEILDLPSTLSIRPQVLNPLIENKTLLMKRPAETYQQDLDWNKASDAQ